MKMERHKIAPRRDWQTKVSALGMNYHTVDGQVYWNEEAFYQFDAETIDKIDDATQELYEMSMAYASTAIQAGNYEGYGFSDDVKNLIEKSWNNGHPYLYGRFDLGINRHGDIKMFEFNADTPTSLLEASIIQWNWKEELFRSADQFNSIHERLVAWFEARAIPHMFFSTMWDAPHEDWGNLHYLMACQIEAGFNGTSINLEQIGWDENNSQIVDLKNRPITHLFKLYPWEWMVQDEFASRIPLSQTFLIEPAWKMLLSNKLLCVKLWEMYPNHPLLLDATFNYHQSASVEISNNLLNKKKIAKPLLGREGQQVVECMHEWPVMDRPYIIQEKFEVAQFDGLTPVLGSWVVGDVACGHGIREDVGITTNNSKFVPHIF